MRKSLLLAFILFIGTKTNAQLEKVIYQYFSVTDSTFEIKIDVVDPYEVITWQGANIMVETNISFKGAPLQLLLLTIKDGRYNINVEDNFPSTEFYNRQRSILKNTTTGENVIDKVFLRIYIPEEFYGITKASFVRRDDIVADPRRTVNPSFMNESNTIHSVHDSLKLTKIYTKKGN
ncbi:MAG TPA: hypothetical protein V6C58_25195 [Allocoleopsis sp.]